MPWPFTGHSIGLSTGLSIALSNARRDYLLIIAGRSYAPIPNLSQLLAISAVSTEGRFIASSSRLPNQ